MNSSGVLKRSNAKGTLVASWRIGMSVEGGNNEFAKILEAHLRTCGNEVILVVPDATLEEVGEALLIATHGEYDRKTVGKLCLQQAIKYLLGPLQSPASIVIN